MASDVSTASKCIAFAVCEGISGRSAGGAMAVAGRKEKVFAEIPDLETTMWTVVDVVRIAPQLALEDMGT